MTSTDVTITSSIDPRPSWLTVDEWPFPLRGLEVGGRRIAYTDTGEGPALLLVHTGMWSFVWRDVIGRLADRFRVVTLDAPGTGLSDGSAQVDFAVAADAVDALVRCLDLDDIVLVFHDLGGPVTLEAAARWPERVAGLVAVNAFGWQPSGVPFRAMLGIMGSAPMRELDAATGFLSAATSTRLGVGRHWDKATRKTFRRGMTPAGRRSLHRYMRAARRHDYETITSVVDRFASMPLLTIFGERNDPLRFQAKWAERFPLITQVQVAKGNHFPMCDDPELIATTIIGWHDEVLRPARPA